MGSVTTNYSISLVEPGGSLYAGTTGCRVVDCMTLSCHRKEAGGPSYSRLDILCIEKLMQNSIFLLLFFHLFH